MAVPGGIGGTPPSAALDQFLTNSYEVVQAVHRNLDAIRAVADHLTPVEDLVEFQNEIAALYAKLDLLVAASELMLSASDAGIALLQAADVPAQRALLELGSAALRDESYFATATSQAALQAQVDTLSTVVDGILAAIPTFVTQDQLDVVLAGLNDQIGSIGGDNASVRQDLDALLVQLGDGTYVTALATALDELTARVTVDEDGVTAIAQHIVELDASIESLDGTLAGQATALNVLSATVTSNGDDIAAVASNVVDLTTQVYNTELGLAAQSESMQLLESRTEIVEGTVTANSEFLTVLDAHVDDALNQVAITGGAISGLETRISSNEDQQFVLSQSFEQLDARVVDTETGLISQAEATSVLSTRVDSTEDAIEIASEERTSLRSSLSSTGNFAPNPAFAVNTRGWTLFSRGDGWLDAQLDRDHAPIAPGALPAGMHALSLFQDEIPAGNAGVRSINIPVEDLGSYILSGYIAAEYCTVRLEWRLFDGTGAEIGFGLIGQVTDTAPSARLSEWTRVWGEIPVAADGAQVQIQLWITSCHAGYPKAWLLRPQLEPKLAEQVGPSPWMDGVIGIEETFSDAVQSLETRVTSTEDEIDTMAAAVTALDSQVGTMQQWRITHHSGSDTYDTVGSPLPPGLRLAGNTTPVHTFQRGLTLVRFALDGSLASADRFDVFSSVGERNNLRDALLALTEHDPFILVSQDHHGIKQTDLTAAMELCGAFAYANVTGSRPYLLIGCGLAGKGGGLEVLPVSGRQWQDYYVTVVNDTPKGLGERTGVMEAIAGQATALESLTTRVTSNEDGLTAVSSSVTDLDARLSDAETGLDAQGSALTELTTQVESIDGVVTALSTSSTELSSRVGNVESGLINEMITSSNKNEAFTSSINSLGARMTDAEGDLSANTSAVGSLTARVDVVEGTVTSHSSALTSLQSQVDSMDTGTGGYGSAISALDTRVTANENSIESMSSDITTLQSSVVNANKVFVQPTAPPLLDRTDGDLWFDSDDGNKPYSYNLTLNAWVAMPDMGKNRIFVQPGAPTADNVNDMWFDSDDGYKQYRWTGSAWAYCGDARIGANATAIAGLTTRVNSTEDSIDAISEDVVDLQTVVNGSSGVTATASALSALTTRVTSAEGVNTTQSSQITTLQNTVNNATTGVSATATAVSGLTTRMTAAEGVNTSQGSAITSLQNTVNNSTTGVTATANGLSALTTRVTAAEGVNTSQGTAITALQNTVNNATTGVSATASAVSALSTRVSAAEGVNTSQGTAITALQNTINNPTTGLAATSSAVGTLTTRVDDIDGAMASQATSITNLTASLGESGGDNLLLNSSFENGSVFWTPASSGATGLVTTFPATLLPVGSQSIRLAATAGAAGHYIEARAPTTNRPTVIAGKKYTLSAYARGTATGTIAMYIQWINASGGIISTPSSLGNAVSSSVFGRYVLTATAPAGAVAAGVFPARLMAGGAGSIFIEVDNIQFQEGDVATGYKLSGLETANAVETLDARVTTTESGVSVLQASWNIKLDVNGYVSGVTSVNDGDSASFIVAADKFSIVKPGGGARLEYSGNNMRVYDAAGTMRVRLGVW